MTEPETFSGDRVVFFSREDGHGEATTERSGSGRAAWLRSGLAGPGPLLLLPPGLAAPACRELIDGPLGTWVPSGSAESDGQPYIFFLHLKSHPSVPPENLKITPAGRSP